MDTHLAALESLPPPRTMPELLERITLARAALERLVGSLNEQELAAPGTGGDWPVKDHLAHIATWEQMLAAHLREGADHEVVGMDEATYERLDMDSLNAAIYAMHRNRDVTDVLAQFRDAHAAVLELLDTVDAGVLQKPYSAADPEQRTVMQEIVGNTYHHYLQHLRWIEEQRQEPPESA